MFNIRGSENFSRPLLAIVTDETLHVSIASRLRSRAAQNVETGREPTGRFGAMSRIEWPLPRSLVS